MSIGITSFSASILPIQFLIHRYSGVQSYIAEYLKIENTDKSEISGIVGS